MKIRLSIYRKIGSVAVSVNTLVFIFAAAALFTGILTEYLVTLLFVFAHEAGHIFAAIRSEAVLKTVRILPVGLNAEIQADVCSKGQRIFIYSAGPCTSILFAIIFAVLISFGINSPLISLAMYTNLYLAVFNLLPALPLDGGKITMELLAVRLGVIKAGRGLQFFSVLFSVTLILIGLEGLAGNTGRICLVVIGLYILTCIGRSREEAAFMNIKNLLFRKSRVIKKGIYPVRELIVLKHAKLADVVKACDYIDMFHIVNVVDDDLRVIKVMTEQELVDAIVENTPDTTFENLMHIGYNKHGENN